MSDKSVTCNVKSAARKAMCLLASMVLVIAVFPVASYGVTAAEKKAEADAARAELYEMSAQLDAASDAYFEAMEEHDTAVANMQAEQERINELQVKIQESQDALRKRAVAMYRGDKASMLDVLLGSASYTDFATTWSLLEQLNEDTAQIISDNKSLKQQSEQAYAAYQEQEQIAAQKLEEAEAARVQAEQLVAEYQAKVNSLDAEVAELIAQEKAAEEEAQRKAWEAQQAAAAAAAAQSSASQQTASNTANTAQNQASTVTETTDQTYYETTTTNNVGSGVGAAVVGYANSKLGCPYVWATAGPNTFDCSGLTSWCYAQAGISIPRTSSAQLNGGTRISLSEAQPGDILWMSGHVGIYIGNGAYIHAPTTGDVVKVAYNMNMWTCAVRY